MFIDGEWREPISSFVASVPPPTADPDAGDLVHVHFAREWLPYVLGALTQLQLPTTWRSDDSAVIALAQARASELITMLAIEAESPMPYPLFRFTNECGMEVSYDGENYVPVPGWTSFAASCFTGPQGPQGIQGATGAAGAAGAAGADATSPIGAIFPCPTTVVPAGYLLCDGATYLKSAYPALWAVLNVAFEVSGTQFKVPDLRGRTVIGSGQGTGLTNRAVGATVGNETHQLTTAEMPAHSHMQRLLTSTSGAISGEVDAFDATASNTVDTGLQTGNTGGGGAHNNMQPSLALPYIIKAQ